MTFTIPNEADAAVTDQAEIDSIDLQIMTSGNQFDGVINGCAVNWSAGMAVQIAAGQISVSGYFPFLSATVLSVSAPTAGGRFDLVVANYNAVISLATGSASTSNPVFPTIPANSVVLASLYAQAGDAALATTRVIDKRISIQNIFEQESDFVQGIGQISAVGELRWTVGTQQGTGVTLANAPQAGVASHPGIYRLGVTSTTNSDRQWIAQGPHGSFGAALATSFSRFRFVVRLNANTNETIYIGLSDQTQSNADPWGSNGVYLAYNATVASDWYANLVSGGTKTFSDTTVTGTAGNWYDLECVQLQSGQWQYVVNKTLRAILSGAPTTAVQLGMLVSLNTATAQTADIDFIGYNLFSVGTRYT